MRSVLALVSVLVLSSVAFAEDHYNVELSGGTNAGVIIGTGSPSTTRITIDTEAAVPLMDPVLDGAIELGFVSLSGGGTSTWVIEALAGPQLNFGDANPRNSFFLFAGAGLDVTHALSSTHTGFLFGFKGGKRFMISNSVSFSPFVKFSKADGADGVFSIFPVSFSLFL